MGRSGCSQAVSSRRLGCWPGEPRLPGTLDLANVLVTVQGRMGDCCLQNCYFCIFGLKVKRPWAVGSCGLEPEVAIRWHSQPSLAVLDEVLTSGMTEVEE